MFIQIMHLGNIVIGSGGAKTTSDPSYAPPPHGGGVCISTRDCYPLPTSSATTQSTGGTCRDGGVCVCQGDYTGSYCQVIKVPNFDAYCSIKVYLH